MIRWLNSLNALLKCGTPVMMVTVVASKGSVPREAGSRMLVHENGFDLTVGGGQLEFEALDTARKSLAAGAGAHMQTFTLGPDLGQCCGGSATMLFEPFSPADAAWVEKMSVVATGSEEIARIVQLAADGNFKRNYLNMSEAEGFLDEDVQDAVDLAQASDTGLNVTLLEGACRLIEILRDDRQPVWLFGAGHVGRAIVSALTPLPFALTWIDARDDGFPSPLPPEADIRQPAMPELLVEDAPPGTMFLVMTHSHASDQSICEAVLRRGDAAYLGLIGSHTKDAKFRARFRARGLGEEMIEQMICPIGLPGLRGKEPAVIAASVAADLLVRLDKTMGTKQVDAPMGDELNV